MQTPPPPTTMLPTTGARLGLSKAMSRRENAWRFPHWKTDFLNVVGSASLTINYCCVETLLQAQNFCCQDRGHELNIFFFTRVISAEELAQVMSDLGEHLNQEEVLLVDSMVSLK
jgi:hypothetical protein